jgi:flagellar motility protein MotE (MotC chaperone)
VERGSPLACADDVIELAKDAIFADPITLATCHKNMDPATADRLPSPIDLIAHGLHKHTVLADRVAEAFAAHARDIADLDSTVNAKSKALADQVAALARDLADQRQQLQTVLDTHQEELQAVQARLALLERSPWAKLKKLVDH